MPVNHPASYLSQAIAVLTGRRRRLCTDFKGIYHSVTPIFNIQREDHRCWLIENVRNGREVFEPVARFGKYFIAPINLIE